jgi:hypothetical protein
MTVAFVTRAVVVVSTIAAALAEGYLATTPYHPQVYWIALAGFVILLGAGSRLRAFALPVLMAALYLMPAILLVWRGGENFSLDIIWILPLVGLMLSGRGALEWSLPARWQWPLVTWAVVVSVSWPIIFLRESDFALWILPLARVSNSSIGIGPWEVGLNVVYMALGHTVGILWIDALFRWYAGDRARFRRDVLAGLLTAAGLASAVAIYQGLVDLSFLNSGFWVYMIRASGTLADPNKLGAVAAFWTVGAIVFAQRLTQPWRTVLTIGALLAGLATVWVCGSRTGLAAVIVSVTVAAVEAGRRWWATRSTTPINIGRVLLGGAGAIALSVGLVLVLQQASTHTIVQRGALGYLPFIGDLGVVKSANMLLWERNGYGPAAMLMVKEHPIDGIGVGLFHSQAHDFGRAAGYRVPQPDNAQNWFRHVIAELGVLGSLPMLWWCWVALTMLFARNRTGDHFSSGMLRGVLIGFVVASTFGMPAQSIAIVLTFWVFMFWFSLEADVPVRPSHALVNRTALKIAVAVIVGHLGMTTVDAFGELRPRERSMRFNWFYRYGLSELEPDPGGDAVGRRFTITNKSLAVVKVEGKTLKFAAWIDHPDGDANPVHTRIWVDSNLVYEGNLKRSAPLLLSIPAMPGQTHLVLETEIDRLFRPSDFGSRDERQLGLSIRDWVWDK